MPKIVEQTKNGPMSSNPPQMVGAAPATAGSILGTAIPVADLREDWIKICLYGRNRVGKTTLACCFPKPLLLVSFEPSETGGAMSVTKVPGVSYLRISNKALINPVTRTKEKIWGSQKALMLAAELRHNNPYKTVVVDTATSYQDLILQEIMGLSDVPEMLSWGMVSEEQYRDRSSKTREALRPFLDLTCNVVVCAQEKDHNPPKDRSQSKLTRGMQLDSFFAADLGGATVKWLHDACGYIGQLYEDEVTETKTVSTGVKGPDGKYQTYTETVGTGKRVRRLRTMYHPNFAAGFRSATPDAVPEYIDGATPQQMYDRMMMVIRGVKIK